MPCDSVRNIGVLLKDANLDLMTAALRTMGHNPVRVGTGLTWGRNESYNGSELRVRSQDEATTIRKSYAAEIVKSQARKFGWTLKSTGPYQFEVVKR